MRIKTLEETAKSMARDMGAKMRDIVNAVRSGHIHEVPLLLEEAGHLLTMFQVEGEVKTKHRK